MADVKPYQAILPLLIRIVQNPSEHKYKHKGYEKAVKHANEMAVHLYGRKPVELLERVRPREDPAITEYRLESYEPTTVSVAGKAITLTGKIFNPKLYGIKEGESTEAQALYNYAMVEYPGFNSVVNFLAGFGLKKNMSDPNGVYLIEPDELPTTVGPDGEIRVDVTKEIYPVITPIASENIWLINPNYGLFFIKKEEQTPPQGGAKIDFWYFKYVDKVGVYDFYMYTNNSKDYFTGVVSTYLHQFNELPFWYMGGEHDQNVIGLFESFFYPAVPYWNKAITAESDLDGAFVSHLHPQKWEVADDCEYMEETDHGSFSCDRGWIRDHMAKGGKYICSGCNGSGRKSVKGPHSQYWVSKDKLSDPTGATLNQPPAGYIDVPTAATQMLVERAQKLKEDGLSALNMDIVNKIGNNQSGEAKAYDRTELFDFLGKVRDLFYDRHLVNIFYYFSRYMFIGKSDEDYASIEPAVIKPNDFDILTTSELMEQIKVGKDANVNAEYIRAKNIEINNKEFQNHPEQLEFLNQVTLLQPFSGYSVEQISTMVLDGTASKLNAIIHNNISDFVRRAMEEDDKFVDKTYMEKMEVLSEMAQEEIDLIAEESKVSLEAAQAAMIQPEGAEAPNTPPDNDAE